VNVQDHRQGAPRVDDRQAVVAHHVEAVARLDQYRVHRGERQPFKVRPVSKEEPRLLCLTVVAVVANRPVVLQGGYDPPPVVECPADNLDVAVSDRPQVLHIRSHVGVQDLPLLTLERECHRLDVVRRRVEHYVAYIGPRVFRQDGLRPDLQVYRGHGGRISVPAVAQMKGLATPVEAVGRRRHEVFHLNFHERLAGLRVGEREHLTTAVGRDPDPQPYAVIVVHQQLGEIVVSLDQSPVRRGDVDPIEVVILRVTVVETHDDLSREPGANAHPLCVHVLQEREVGGSAGVKIDRVDVPLFVTGLVLKIQDVPRRVGPEVASNTPIAVLRYRSRGTKVS
jgi:hypothetical protein